MKNAPLWMGLGLAGGLCSLTIGASAPAAPALAGGSQFEVTIKNLTRGQIFSPVLAATHRSSAALFVLGEPASDQLARLAEEGDNVPLADLLAADATVLDVQTGFGPVLPGASETLVVTADSSARVLSLATMLVNSNDAFAALDGIPLPTGREVRAFALAYDAGSELNSEDCDFIPGPACGSSEAHDPADAEGFVYVSNGIQGVGDLGTAAYDWRNPVAEVTIRRVAR